MQPRALGRPPRPAAERDDDVGGARRLPVLAPRERQQQVRCDRAPAELPRCGDLAAHPIWLVDPDRPEAAGAGDGTRQCPAGQAAAHARLYDGQLHPEALEHLAQAGAARSRRSRRCSSASDWVSICTNSTTNAISSTTDCSSIIIAPPTFWSSTAVSPQIRGTVS